MLGSLGHREFWLCEQGRRGLNVCWLGGDGRAGLGRGWCVSVSGTLCAPGSRPSLVYIYI